MDSRFLSRFFFGFSVLLAAACLFFFCFGSTKTMQTALSLETGRLRSFVPFLLLLLSVGSLFGFLLSFVFRIERNDALSWGINLTELRPESPSWMRWVPWIGAGAVWAVALSQLNAPLHWEDLFHLSNIVRSPWERFNPLIKTEHHTLASMAAYGSVKLFGMHKPAVLLPAYVFAAGYLLVLLGLSRRFLCGTTALLLFAHLACNQMAVWYMHSMRGYCLAMLLCSATLYLMWSTTESAVDRMRRDRILLLLVSVAATFTHLFAALFVLIAVASLAIWVVLNRAGTEGWRIRHVQRILIDFLIVTLPLYSFIIFFQMLWLERLGDLFKGGFPDITGTLLRTFGSSFEWSGKILMLLALFVAAANVMRRPVRSPRYLSVLIVCLTVFLIVVMRVLEVRLLETRFILPFLAPFVIWLGEGLARIANPVARVAAISAAVIGLVVSPTLSRQGVYEYLTANVRDFDRFMQIVRTQTGPTESNCYTFSGEPNLIYFSRSLYFGSLQGNSDEPSDCKQNYHLYFASPATLAPADTRHEEPAAIYTRVAGIENRMILFKKKFIKNELVGMQSWTP